MKLQITALTISLVSLSLSSLLAQEHHHVASDHAHAASHPTEKGHNGGTLQTVGTLQIETVLKDKGIVFFVLGSDGQMVKAPDAVGSLKLKIGDKPKEYNVKLQALKNQGIGAAVDLSKLKGQTLHMDVVLRSLGDTPIEFHAMGKLADSVSDAMLISLQKTCPVTGKDLGSMGKPPKIMVGGKPLFVCCPPCSAKVKAKPYEYLAKYYTAKGKETRPGVLEATLADADAIAAQKKCPVMDEELGGMGTPQKVNVKGKSVYICCVGCAKKLHAEPDKYLAMLKEQGIAPPDFK